MELNTNKDLKEKIAFPTNDQIKKQADDSVLIHIKNPSNFKILMKN